MKPTVPLASTSSTMANLTAVIAKQPPTDQLSLMPQMVAGISQLLRSKPLLLDLLDVSLGLQAGANMNSAECTWLIHVLIWNGELPTPRAALSSVEPVEPPIQTSQRSCMMPQMLI